MEVRGAPCCEKPDAVVGIPSFFVFNPWHFMAVWFEGFRAPNSSVCVCVFLELGGFSSATADCVCVWNLLGSLKGRCPCPRGGRKGGHKETETSFVKSTDSETPTLGRVYMAFLGSWFMSTPLDVRGRTLIP